MNYKIIVIVLILLLSGCVESPKTSGKYVLTNASNPDTITFTPTLFYASEYNRFTKSYTEFTGTYTINADELILKYEFMGIVQRFNISADSQTLTETNGKTVYVWGET